MRMKGLITKDDKEYVLKQILPTSNIQNIWRKEENVNADIGAKTSKFHQNGNFDFWIAYRELKFQ